MGALLLLWLYPLGAPLLDYADGVGYLAPAISLVEDGDLHYLDEYQRFSMAGRYFRPTATGLVGNHWNLGLGLLLAPLVAWARLWEPGDLGRSSQVLFTSLQSLALLASLGCAWWTLRSRALLSQEPDGAPPWERAAWLLALYLGTPLAFYAHQQSVRPHVWEAALACLIFWLSLRHWQRPTAPPLWAALCTGAASAALLLVRTQAAIWLVLPLALGGWALWEALRARDRQAARHLLGALGLLLAPVAVAWWQSKQVSGLLYGDGPRFGMVQALTQNDWYLWQVLVDPNHGLLSWTPLVGLCLVGMGLLAARRPGLGAILWLVFAVQVWLNGTNFYQEVDLYQYTRHWTGGGSFGARRFLSCSPAFAVGLWELRRCAGQRLGRAGQGAFWALVALATLWSAALMVQGALYPGQVLEGSMTWGLLWRLALDAPRALGVWLEHALGAAPSPGAALPGLLSSLCCLGLALGAARLLRGWQERQRLAAVALAAVLALVVVRVGWALVEINTESAREAAAPQMQQLAQVARSRTPCLHLQIREEQARLHLLTGEGDRALARYRDGLARGCHSARAAGAYLELVERLRPEAEAQKEAARLRRRYPEL